MLRVREGLELAHTINRPFGKAFGARLRFSEDASQKRFLAPEPFRPQSGFLSGALESGEVDVGGDVSAARIFKDIGANLMTGVSTQRARPSFRAQPFPGGEPVINSQELSGAKALRASAPDAVGAWGNLDGVPVGQDGGQFDGNDGLMPGRLRRETAQLPIQAPDVVERDAPFPPFFERRIPAETVHRQRIKEFVGKNHAAHAALRGGNPLKPSEV